MQRKVLVVTNGMKSPKRIGQIVEDVLVADLRVPSVRFLDANASSVLAHGKSQSLVVDCGFWETTCVPVRPPVTVKIRLKVTQSFKVFEYIPLLAYASSSSCGADAVNQQFALGDDRDSTAFDRDKFQLILPETPSGDSQDAAIEVLFTGDEDDRSIVDCILDSLTKVGSNSLLPSPTFSDYRTLL